MGRPIQTVARSNGPRTMDQSSSSKFKQQYHSSSPSQKDEVFPRRAYIALGSNVGDRLDMIERACRALDADPDMRVTRTSSLYETEPMYVEDQARFLNGACEVRLIKDLLA